MEDKKILKNFEPFDGMKKMFKNCNYPYTNCIYDTCLTIAEHFNMNTLPILSNAIFVYNFDIHKLSVGNYFSLNVINVRKTKDILDELGVKITAKSPQIDCLKNELINSISNENPIAIYIDLFFQNGREFYYHKKHGLHTTLIYGYDLPNNKLYTIDDITEFTKYTLLFPELENYCNGIFENYNFKIGEFNYYFEYSLKPHFNNPSLKQEELIYNCITNFANTMINHQSEIIDSLKNIKYLSDVYEYIIPKERFLENLSSTIYRKCSEKYRLITLYKHNFDILNTRKNLDPLMDIIIKDWRLLRSISAKAFYSQKFDNKMNSQCSTLIQEIYEKENEYNEIFFSLLNAWKMV